MRPIEPDGGDAQADNLRLEVDETFRRLAQAKYAPKAFYAQVMARAADLQPPRQNFYHDFDLHLPRAATVALASVLLLCMVGLGYLYHRVGQMQTVVEQEQMRQNQHAVEVARLPQAHGAPPPDERKHTLGTLTEGERGELSSITLEVDPPSAKDDDAMSADHALVEQERQPGSRVKSILDRVVDTLRWAFGVVWDKVKELTAPPPSPSP